MGDLPVIQTEQFNYGTGTSSPVRIAQETPNQAQGFKATVTDLPDGTHRYEVSQDGEFTSVQVDAEGKQAISPLSTTRGKVRGEAGTTEADKFAKQFSEALQDSRFAPGEIAALREYNSQSQLLPAGGVRVASNVRGGGAER